MNLNYDYGKLDCSIVAELEPIGQYQFSGVMEISNHPSKD